MKENRAPLILGIDPGYDRVGWGIGKKENNAWSTISFGCIKTDAKLNLVQRYEQIYQELQVVLQTYQPSECAIEQLFFFKNQTTALQVSEARGVILSCLIRQQIPIFEYTPLQIKQTVTGYGRADKKSVEKMVRLEFALPQKILDDTIDALAIVITHQANRTFKAKAY